MDDYFPVAVTWSLPYEVEMYLVLPLLFFFVRRNLTLWPLLVFWVFTILVCRPLFPHATHNFFLCIPYFLPGVMAYVGFSRWQARLPAVALPLWLVVLWAGFLLRPSWRRADLLCLVVGLSLPVFHQFRTKLVTEPSHYIAKYSYVIYLAHPFAIVCGVHSLPHTPLALQLGVVLGLTALLSVAAYHLLEHPMIRLGSRLANRIEMRYERRAAAQLLIPEAEIR